MSTLCPACLSANSDDALRCASCDADALLHGRYRLREVLGGRGDARTYLAVDRDADPQARGGDEVVVKELALTAAADWKQIELFERGTKVLRWLDCPGVPRHVDDFQQVRGGVTHYFVVQQKIPGVSLAAALQRGERFGETRARRIADDVLTTLTYLHGLSPAVIHRDIKPSNVMAHEDGRYVLIDFDLVQDTANPHGGSTTALGTVGFAPLEQLMGRAVPASDLYGLGATLIAVLSRRDPADLFDAGDHRLDFREYINVSEELAEVLEKMVEPSLDERFATAAEVLDALAARPAAARPKPAKALPTLKSTAALPVAAASTPPPLTAVAVQDETAPDVVVEQPLSTRLPQPPWVLPMRIAITVGAAMYLRMLGGWYFGIAMILVWFISKYFVRWRVSVADGEALHYGVIGQVVGPASTWVRQGFEPPYKISMKPWDLAWELPPLATDEGPVVAKLRLRVQACRGESRNFTALMKYDLWSAHPTILGNDLREHALAAVTNPILSDGPSLRAALAHDEIALERVRGRTEAAVSSALEELGLEVVSLEELRLERAPSLEEPSPHRIRALPAAGKPGYDADIGARSI